MPELLRFYEGLQPVYHVLAVFVFIIGACIGSFLNVVIWRVPRGESIVVAPSHCPHCHYHIAWYENIPLVSWFVLGGRCSRCRAPITPRYVIVEAVTAGLFLLVYLRAWDVHMPPARAGVYFFLVGLLVAVTWIDLDHLIIPDEISLTGIIVAVVAALAWPATHDFLGTPGALEMIQHKSLLFQGFVRTVHPWWPGLLHSARALSLLDLVLGVVFGAGILWLFAELGKLWLGRRRVRLQEPVTVTLDATGFTTPADGTTPWDDLFLRDADELLLDGRREALAFTSGPGPAVEPPPPPDGDERIRVTEGYLHLAGVALPLARLESLRLRTRTWVEPREAMGMGDVKLLGVLGAFLGPGAAVFILAGSALIGALVGLVLMVVGGLKLSSRIPFGPYIALAALVYLLVGGEIGYLYAWLMLWVLRSPAVL